MDAVITEGLPGTGLWAVDPNHSSIRFRLRHHAVATFSAGFSELSGSYDADAGKLLGEVTTASVQVPIEALRRHLQLADFFDAAQCPVIRFEANDVREAAGSLDLVGSLTMRGVTREVPASGTVRGPVEVRHPDGTEAMHFAMDLSATIDRRDYGMTFNGLLPGGLENLGWQVTVEAALELVGQLAEVSETGVAD